MILICKTNASTILFFCLLAFATSCIQSNSRKEDENALQIDTALFHSLTEELTDVIVRDIFSPPAASRVYVYPSIAAYEVQAYFSDSLKSFSDRLTGFQINKGEHQEEEVDPAIATLAAFLLTSKAFVFSGAEIDKSVVRLKEHLDSLGYSASTIESSFQFGDIFSANVINWSKQDKYAETRSAPKYKMSADPGKWKPTPPAFMEGIEPEWRELRTMVIGDLKNYRPVPALPFSMEKDSEFFQELLEAKAAVDEATEEQRAIAAFWDCNPYVMNVSGHMMFASKKITPGGHWMGISAIAAKKANLDFARSVEVQALTAIAIYDAFISCWDEKYRSNLVRPETLINEFLDQDWKPLLQTPPFPEYTSGHSVISTAAAIVLNDFFGENFEYIDDVEVKYGLPSRKFSSFIQASQEAAISRLYGGIHYRSAIEKGVEQGEKIGNAVLEKLAHSGI